MSQQVAGINPQILVWARETAGHSIEEVAAALKKDPAVVVSWETGTAALTYVQLEKLAYKVYKRPIALFFFPEPPVEVDTRQEFRTLPDAEIEDLSPDTRLKVREAVALQLSLAELTGGINPSQRRILRDIAVSVPVTSAVVAGRVREYLGIPLEEQSGWHGKDEALKAWRAAVEDAGIFVFKDSFRQRAVSGFSLYDEQFPLIVINNSTAVSRQIFTLFHELAHLLLHESGVTKKDDRFVETLSGEARRVEVFCNRFAADFLLPSEEFGRAVRQLGTGDRAVAELASQYHVSREVVLRRMLEMGLVSPERYRRQAAQWAEEYENARAAGKKGQGNYYNTQAAYLSERYTNLAFSSYYQGSISAEKLADYLNIKVKSLPGLEQVVLQRAAKV